MFESSLIIAGASVASSDGRTFDRLNPVTGAVATRAQGATEDDALAACTAASLAFRDWSRTGPGLRRNVLLKAEEALRARTPEIVAAMQAELGASEAWAKFNIHVSEGIIREAAALTTMVTGQTIPSDVPGLTAMTTRRPAGVVLSIAPWNGPVILASRAIAMPLACGNTVVLKGSEVSPQTHRIVVQCFLDAGLPAGALNYLNNVPTDAPEMVAGLIAHPAVRRINFTGSSRIGRVIAGLAAEQLKPCLLELGGKSPMVILEDADLNEAARAANFGCFMNSGQVCMSTERIVVDDRIADAFLERFALEADRLGISDEAQVKLGPLSITGARERIDALIDDALAKGAIVVRRGACEGSLMGPIIVDRVTPDMRLYHEESFGPVASVVRFTTLEQAVSIANDTEYGLAASVFGRDLGRALQVIEQLDAGVRHVNMATVHDQAHMPFGGLKASGYGRFNGLEAINEFTDTCLTTYRTVPAQHYPY